MNEQGVKGRARREKPVQGRGLERVEYKESWELDSGKAEQVKPVAGRKRNASPLIRRLALPLAPLINPHIVPKDKEIEIVLERICVREGTTVVQELLEQPIDALDKRSGAGGSIQNVRELLGGRNAKKTVGKRVDNGDGMIDPSVQEVPELQKRRSERDVRTKRKSI